MKKCWSGFETVAVLVVVAVVVQVVVVVDEEIDCWLDVDELIVP